jgi:biotin carboxylase
MLSHKSLHIFVVGLEDFHLEQLESLPNAGNYRFHALFTHRDIKNRDHLPVKELLTDGIGQLQAFPEHVDAIVGYWDFPVSTLLPLLRQAVGLQTPSLESVLKCEHKYWSRLLQQQVIPQHVPQFTLVDPFAEEPFSQVPLNFPFWLKPVKSVSSHLGFRINDRADFDHAIQRIRKGIGRYAVPFNQVLEKAELSPEIPWVDGHHCTAESIISTGHQCTVEGYVCHGEVVVYGVIDSLREGPQGSSFSRYQYPSTLSPSVQERMRDICQRLMPHLGYDNAPFNIEFFWDDAQDHLWLLEINPRISKSHAPLFYRVDGCYHYQVMIDLALGRKPQFPTRQGEYACAAKFMVRRYENALVTRVPTPEEIRHLEAENPFATIEIEVEAGVRLSTLKDQDSYSYEIAVIFIGGENSEDLEAKYHHILKQIPLELGPVEASSSSGAK